ncbi:MAG: hypothetical protein GOMPHAMPRED_001389 [Gomphillus americanus]|uniref:Microbial-type PARG catalytic domain-containing protein n=1 Tax=Gomphillus americanus TaxID=1940652 RepID=A0A8H3ILB2_9LECA|nr:MAG: hypothetical protein GOMPHAMPRED_001389 [Gomphillus americanus]
MPAHGPKPSEIAVEAKRIYIPKIEQYLPELPAQSFAYSEVAGVHPSLRKGNDNRRLRIAVIDADAVDVALQWNYEEGRSKSQDLSCPVPSNELRIPLILPVDEKRAGGDWESGSMAPEENMSRRSNFVRCLARSRVSSEDAQIYPIPSKGGIYCPHVVVIFRSGPADAYTAWEISRWNYLPVISVAPNRRPKLTTDGEDYTFAQERELMQDKIRTALRLAATWGHRDICVGPFGFGPGFRNPAKQLSTMWKDILFQEEEFKDAFYNVVFAIETRFLASSATESSAGSNQFATGLSVYEVFKNEFDPSNLCKLSYCKT